MVKFNSWSSFFVSNFCSKLVYKMVCKMLVVCYIFCTGNNENNERNAQFTMRNI